MIPGLIRDHADGRALRLWIPGCSTGEESYSLAILFLEAIEAAKLDIKLQVFASDVDADAIAVARLGIYPETITTDVASPRLARYFLREDQHYKVTPALRNVVVFTVQDVLADPPFSKIDLVSCRNLMVYLEPEAQVRLILLFHFALRPGGVLFIGAAETPGEIEGRFDAISRERRVYRRLGQGRLRDPASSTATFRDSKARLPSPSPAVVTPQTALAELCRTMVLETHAPAAVLINAKHDYLFGLGLTRTLASTRGGRGAPEGSDPIDRQSIRGHQTYR